jgi:hypothetical protein
MNKACIEFVLLENKKPKLKVWLRQGSKAVKRLDSHAPGPNPLSNFIKTGNTT